MVREDVVVLEVEELIMEHCLLEVDHLLLGLLVVRFLVVQLGNIIEILGSLPVKMLDSSNGEQQKPDL